MDDNSFDMAASAAEQDLQTILRENPELRNGILKLAGWWKKWFMTAGHKRLGRILTHLS